MCLNITFCTCQQNIIYNVLIYTSLQLRWAYFPYICQHKGKVQQMAFGVGLKDKDVNSREKFSPEPRFEL